MPHKATFIDSIVFENSCMGALAPTFTYSRNNSCIDFCMAGRQAMLAGAAARQDDLNRSVCNSVVGEEGFQAIVKDTGTDRNVNYCLLDFNFLPYDKG